MEKYKLVLFIAVVGIIIAFLGGLYYLVETNQQKLISDYQQKELQARVDQEKKEYLAKRKKDCYDIELSERKLWDNVDGSEYIEKSDACMVRYRTDKYKGVDCNTVPVSEGLECRLGTFAKKF